MTQPVLHSKMYLVLDSRKAKDDEQIKHWEAHPLFVVTYSADTLAMGSKGTFCIPSSSAQL